MPNDANAEILGLRRVLRDLTALSAIPAAWVGRQPLAVAQGLADTLIGLLQLDFVAVRLSDPEVGEAVEATRGDGWETFPEWMKSHLGESSRLSRTDIIPDIGGGVAPCRGIVIPIGVNADGGVVAAASDRTDFPTQIDQMLLHLAANQAATAFQNACLIEQRMRAEEELRNARSELEVKIAEQTAEQSALRRVATSVARGVPPEEVFARVTEEVGRLLPVEFANMCRYETDYAISLVATWDGTGRRFPAGTRLMLGGQNLGTLVFETGRPARIDDYANASGPIGITLRKLGLRSSVGTPITVDGRLWGMMAVGSTREPLAPDTDARLADFTELVATAIANAESRAAVAASRARIVTAADEMRRQIERDLHDGVQQRLVSLALAQRAARAAVPPELPDVHAQLSRVADGLAGAVEEVQELSRGIHPAILARGGLAPALKTLALRSAVPVELEVGTEARLPEPVEVAAYYVVSEALTNAAKHAHASSVQVVVHLGDGALELSIRDDGVGGADPTHGSGLIGLADRVDAIGGTIEVVSPDGKGTTLFVKLPCAEA